MSFAKHRSCLFTRTHIHTHRYVHATSIRNAKVLQLRSCKFVYANSHIVMCVSVSLSLYVCSCPSMCAVCVCAGVGHVWMPFNKGHVHFLAINCLVTVSIYRSPCRQQHSLCACVWVLVCVCVCEPAAEHACWPAPTKCSINTFGIMVLTKFKLQLCGLFYASNRTHRRLFSTLQGISVCVLMGVQLDRMRLGSSTCA